MLKLLFFFSLLLFIIIFIIIFKGFDTPLMKASYFKHFAAIKILL